MEIVPLLGKDEGRRKEEGMLGHSGREGKVGEGDESGDITSLKLETAGGIVDVVSSYTS